MPKKKNKIRLLRNFIALFAGILFLLPFIFALYPIKIFDLQSGALIQRIFTDFSISVPILLSAILLLTILFGRLYCSCLCPLGLLQEFIGLFKKKPATAQKNMFFKYIIAAIIFGSLTGGTAYILRLLEPYTYFGAIFTLSALGIIVAVLLIALIIVKDRFFCTNICPVGTVLGLISKLSLNKIYIDKDKCIGCGVCIKHCPSGCIAKEEKKVDNETCIKCFKCLDACKTSATKYGSGGKEKISFSPKRRDIIVAASSAAVFAASAKAGTLIKKASYQKTPADVILPPGAGNEQRFLNKCLNCNLCVKVCPSKIIKKADSKYGAVSIDFDKNFCKFDCIDCSAVCPSGALKKLSLEDKQRTRIAMIAPPREDFKEAVECAIVCPMKALEISEDGRLLFTASKCIGCARCVDASGGKIQIFAAVEQTLVN